MRGSKETLRRSPSAEVYTERFNTAESVMTRLRGFPTLDEVTAQSTRIRLRVQCLKCVPEGVGFNIGESLLLCGCMRVLCVYVVCVLGVSESDSE